MHRLWISSSSLPFRMTAFRSVSGKDTQVSLEGEERRSVCLYHFEPAPALSPSWALSAWLPSH